MYIFTKMEIFTVLAGIPGVTGNFAARKFCGCGIIS